ncbi:MAG: hypothetical protein F6K48_03160 [Okeania sp. SIO3H1]|nr:hypothetical protein [Okeania sp. SIO3H1]
MKSHYRGVHSFGGGLGNPMSAALQKDIVTEAMSADWAKKAQDELIRVRNEYNAYRNQLIPVINPRGRDCARAGSKLPRHAAIKNTKNLRDPRFRHCMDGDENKLRDYERRIRELELRARKQKSEALKRITNDIPYKGHVIKPLIVGDQIFYQLTKNGNSVGTPNQNLDEAKALVDEATARDQEKQVAEWAKERGRAEGVLPALRSMVSPSSEAGPTEQEKSNMGRWLIIGGAAAGALLLLR